VALALEALGACQRLFDLTLEYSKNRHQFGVPIGSFQAVKHKMADLFVSIERTRALVYYAVAAIAEDDPNRFARQRHGERPRPTTASGWSVRSRSRPSGGSPSPGNMMSSSM